jgi:hypothetical protein
MATGRGGTNMAKTRIIILQHGNKFDAGVAGLTSVITNADSAEEAIGRLILLLSHPLGIVIEQEKTGEEKD